MTAQVQIAFVALLVVGIVVAGSAISTLPPDDHEVLVLRTAQEMQQRDDWVVPYFNSEPRLNKPPMNYWLTGLTAALAGQADHVAQWHGRLPSLLAGLGVMVLMVWLGARAFNVRTALYGVGLFVGSAGYFTYTHDARPEMLYTFFCTAGLASFMLATLTKTQPRAALIYLMWLSYALAILTKGPQIPLMFLLASIVFIVFVQGRGIRALQGLKLVSGLIIVTALTLPWWPALEQRLAAAEIANSQLAGSLLVPDLSKVLNGYYLYRPLQLALPWLPLIPLAWIAALRAQDAYRETSQFMAVTIAVVVVVLSFGVQQRYFYMLPVLPIMCLLAGRGIDGLIGGNRAGFRVLMWLQGAIVLAVVGWAHWSNDQLQFFVATMAVSTVVGFIGQRLSAVRYSGTSIALVLLVGACFVKFSDSDLFWSADRRNKHALARSIAATVAPHAPLVTLNLTPAVYVYETARPIPRLESTFELDRDMEQRPDPALYVITYAARGEALARRYNLEEIHAMPEGAGDRAALYRISICTRSD